MAWRGKADDVINETESELGNAEAHLKTALKIYEDALYAHYFVGSAVLFRAAERNQWQAGTIERHGYNGDIRIRMDSGRFVWIRAGNHWGQVKRVEEAK